MAQTKDSKPFGKNPSINSVADYLRDHLADYEARKTFILDRGRQTDVVEILQVFEDGLLIRCKDRDGRTPELVPMTAVVGLRHP